MGLWVGKVAGSLLEKIAERRIVGKMAVFGTRLGSDLLLPVAANLEG